MTDSVHDLNAVEQLLSERDALHGWLTRLDHFGGTTPAAVRDRVRHDYERRLDELTNGLRAHADTIAGKLRDDRSEHATLSGRATAAREALAEAELRHAVGEYEDERFESERTRHGSDLQAFELSLDAVSERIARLEEVHSLVTREPAPVELDDEDIPPDELDDVAIPPEAAEAADLVMTVTVDAEVDGGESSDAVVEIDELTIEDEVDSSLLSVFEDSGAGAQPAPARNEPEPAAEFGPLSFRPRGTPNAERARPAAVPIRQQGRPADADAAVTMPGGPTPPRFVRPGERLLHEPRGPDALLDEEIVATGPAAEPAAVPVGRTLRCGECGAMNRPLEWYCEKCGAELTVA